MSRTYRLRHEVSRRAKKFSDGRYTMHLDDMRSDVAAAIVHGAYCIPCKILGEPVYTWEGWPYGCMRERSTTNHYHICLACLLGGGRPGLDPMDIIWKMAGNQPLEIASMGWHEYAKPSNNDDRYFKRLMNKRSRHIYNTRLRLAKRANNYDDWDILRHHSSYYGYRPV